MQESPVKKAKILVVEDEAVISMHIQSSLQRLGYEICGSANSGNDAVRLAEELRPDLILMDIVLQGDMDGIQAAQIIRERLGTPVVYMTGNADIPTITRARGSDPYGYILKPIDVLHMFSTIDTVMNRRDLELRLEESEERFRAISENIQEGVALTIGFKNSWVNDTFAGIFGYAREELVGQGPEKVIHPDDMPEIMRIGTAMMQGMPTGFTRVRAVRGDGAEIIVEVNGRLFRIEESNAILLIVRDVTESVRAEAALRESEEKYRSLVENLNEIIIAIDEKGVITFVSHSAEAQSGYPQQEMEGRPFLDFIFPDDIPSILENFSKRRQGLTGATECRVVSKSGNPFWVRISGTPIVKDGVFRGVRGLLSNIDERKRAEAALRESEERHRSLTTNLPGAVFQFSIGADSHISVKYVSERSLEVFGLERDPLETFFERGSMFVHPDDREGWLTTVKTAIQNHAAWDWEGRFINPHGHEMWLKIVGQPSQRDDALIYNGIVLDITDRKRAEIMVRESEERFRSMTTNLPGVVYQFYAKDNGEMGMRYVDSRSREIYGIDNEPLEDYLTRFIANIHPEHRKNFLDSIQDAVKNNAPWYWEGQYVYPNGRELWLRGMSQPMRIGSELVFNGLMLDITDRKLAELKLQDSEEKFRSLVQNLQDVIIIMDSDGVIIFENPATQAVLGYSLMGKRGFDIVHPDDLKTAADAFVTVINKTNEHMPTTFRVRHADGSWVHIDALASNMFDNRIIPGMLLVCHNVTQQIKAQTELRESEERNRLLIDNANESIVVLQDWKFAFTNPRFFSLTGYTAEELAARRFAEIVHPDDREMITERYQKRLGGDSTPLTYEIRFFHRDGNIKWTEINSVRIIWEKKPAALLFLRDITERKSAEEERRKIEAQIQQTQKLESLGVLAGGIAHDFNNLLMAILGNIDLALMDTSASSPTRGNLLEAAKASQRAADLCRQMLAYSGRGRFTSEALDMNEIIEDMKHMLEVSVSKKAVLRYNFAAGIPAVDVDVTQVRQIIMNLVINASDAIGQKSGVISMSTGVMACDRAYLSETWLNENLPEGMYVYVEVVDTGCGIDAADLPNIFDPFYTTKFTGRGLGLAAVLGIVRGHRGAIKVYSEKGKGTTFKVLFPAADKDAGRISWKREVGDDWRGSGTILLADDEETIRVLGKRMLERFGFSVLTAENGREAIDIFKEDPERIRCVILDLTMPHMDGEEAFRELRRIRKDACIVMSSGYNEQEINQRFAGKGIAGFIQKPYQMAELASKLRDVLG